MNEKHILVGNGININFGGKDYTNSMIIERLENNLKQNDGRYDDVFAGIVSSRELLEVINMLNKEFNKILKDGVLSLRRTSNEEEMKALVDISRRYKMKTHSAVEIGMEDYFLVLKLFDNAYSDSEEITKSVSQGLKYLFLDSIYNGGEIEKLYLKMQSFSHELDQFKSVFTVNYDTNLDKLSTKKVYHLHGSFNELDDTYQKSTIIGKLANGKNPAPHVIQGKEYLYCNAIMGYSGRNKYDNMLKYNEINNSLVDKSLWVHEYPIEEFQNIHGELHIIGMSPNNDSHIFSMINKNPNISEVHFYCMDNQSFEEAKKIISKSIIKRNVKKYWESIK